MSPVGYMPTPGPPPAVPRPSQDPMARYDQLDDPTTLPADGTRGLDRGGGGGFGGPAPIPSLDALDNPFDIGFVPF